MEVRYEVKHGLFALLLASSAGLCLPLQASTESHIAPSTKQLAPVQTIDVTGYVHDANGEPVIGAGVQVVGSKLATVTDIDGRFSLTVPAGSSLTITYIGFTPQEVKAKPSLDITLSEDSHSLDEVVVVGYGKMKKRDLTGAISSVKGRT